MQSQINKTQILANVKKCHKNISKLNDKLYLLQTLIKKHNFNIEKNTDIIKSKQNDNPIIIINDETSVEVIINAEDPKQEQVIDIKQTARKLISRFYYHIEQKMKHNSINQIEALKQCCDKEYQNDLFDKLHKGFFKLYFEQDQKCKQCQLIIKDQFNCLNHITNEHLADLKIYICIQCKLSFSKGDKLEKHIQQSHNYGQFIQEDTKVDVQQLQIKSSSQINNLQPNFHQKLDLKKIVENIQPQSKLKKVFTQQNNNNNQISSYSDEVKQFNQIYIPVELNKKKNNEEKNNEEKKNQEKNNQEKNNQDKQDLQSYTTKKPTKLKIKFIQKNDNIQNK